MIFFFLLFRLVKPGLFSRIPEAAVEERADLRSELFLKEPGHDALLPVGLKGTALFLKGLFIKFLEPGAFPETERVQVVANLWLVTNSLFISDHFKLLIADSSIFGSFMIFAGGHRLRSVLKFNFLHITEPISVLEALL